MSPPPSSQERIRARLSAFPDRAAFVQGYAPFIAAEGILMRARHLRPPGTQVELELLLADGSPVFQCTGEVTEHRAIGRDGAMAMFIRYDSLTAEAQAVVDEALAHRRRKRRTTASQKAARRTGPQVVASGSFRVAQPSDAQSAVVDDVAGSLESSLDDIFGDFGERGTSGALKAVDEVHRTLPAIHPFQDEDLDDAPTPAPGPPPAPPRVPEQETAPMPLHVATTTEPQQAAPAPKLAARIRRLTGAQETIATSDQPVARRTRKPTPPPLPALATASAAGGESPPPTGGASSPDADAPELELDLGAVVDEDAADAGLAAVDSHAAPASAPQGASDDGPDAHSNGGGESEGGESGSGDKRPGFWSRLFGRDS